MSDIERRFRKELREKAPKQGPILLAPGGSREHAVARLLVERVFAGRRPVEVGDGGFRPTNRERELSLFLEALVDGTKLPPREPLMETIPEALIATFAAEHGVDDEALPQPATRALLDELQEAQDQSVHGLLKSYAALRNQLQ